MHKLEEAYKHQIIACMRELFKQNTFWIRKKEESSSGYLLDLIYGEQMHGYTLLYPFAVGARL